MSDSTFSPVLVCAATLGELETIGLEGAEPVQIDESLFRDPSGRDPSFRIPLFRIPEGYAAVTGVGIPLTILNTVTIIRQIKPARIVCTGIAGAYAGTGWGVGDLVVGVTDRFADLGMEIPDGETPGFAPLGDFPFADDVHREPLDLWTPDWVHAEGAAPARRGHGATVNRCTGTDATGAQRRAQFGVDFETMEGAAVALAARAAGIPVAQIRSISNVAARRDMRPENIRAALDALRVFWATHRVHLSDLPSGPLTGGTA